MKEVVNEAICDVGDIISDFVESLCFSASDDECAKAAAMADNVLSAVYAMRRKVFHRLMEEVSK